jgi:hypothetical protein
MSAVQEQILKLAREITGQSDPQIAVGEALQSFITKRLEQYERAIRRYERKYGMNFAQFAEGLKDKKSVQRLEAKQGILKLENDYFEWEGLISEVEYLHRKLEELAPLAHASTSA